MSKPVDLRFAQPGIVEGSVLLDCRLAENTTIEDLRAGMMRSRLVVVEHVADTPAPAKSKAKKKKEE